MKRHISLILTLVMIITSFNVSGIYAGEDLASHWAGDVLVKWQQAGILKGDQNGKVYPDSPLSRAEFIALLNRVLGNKEMEKKELLAVADLKESDWYYKDMMIALEKGYIVLSAESKVMPMNKISRQEIITMMARLIKKPANFDLSKVKDQDKIAAWANDSVQSMIAGGYIAGYEGKVNPEVNTGKAEAITIINSYKENNRKLYFEGEYELGEINHLTILSGNIKVKSTNAKELMIGKDVKGKIELEKSKIDKIRSKSKEVELYIDGVKTEVVLEEEILKGSEVLYKDGEYEGKAFGYKSDIKVKVTIEKGKITKIDIIEEKEDARYMKAARSVIKRIIDKQQTKVDASSGATLSSKGIMYAVEDALSKAKIKKEEIKKNYKDGEYYGEGAGYAGTVRVKVKIEKSRIEDIAITSHHDDFSYIQSAKNLISDIKKKQSAEVDVISGATYSSQGIIHAVADALSQALGKTDAVGKSEYAKKNRGRNLRENGSTDSSGSVPTPPTTKQKFTNLKNGVYEAVSNGYKKNAIKVEVTVENNRVAKIVLKENKDDVEYFDAAKAEILIKRIIAAQGTDVDIISGATKSSYGLINAVIKALELASEKNTEIAGNYDGAGKTLDTVHIIKDAHLKNVVIQNKLQIDETAGNGDVVIENVTINGDLTIYGGGSNTVRIINSIVKGNIEIDKPEKFDDGHGDDHDHDDTPKTPEQIQKEKEEAEARAKAKKYQRVHVVFEGNTILHNKVIMRKPAIVDTKNDVIIKNLVISKGINNKYQVSIGANIGTLDVKSNIVDIEIKKDSKIQSLLLPYIVETYKAGKLSYQIKDSEKNKENEGDFKITIDASAKILSGKNRETNNTSWLDEDEKEIRTNLEREIAEFKKDLQLNKITTGTYEANGVGFDTSKMVRTSFDIIKEGEILKINSGRITYFGDSGSYEPAARRMFEFINGKTLDEVIDNIAVMQVQYKYVNVIDNSKNEEERYQKAVSLIGRTAANAIRSSIPEDATKRTLMISAPIKKFITGELPQKKPMFDAITGATMSAGGVANSINNALKLSIHDAKVGNTIHKLRISGEFADYPFNKVVFARAGDILDLSHLQVNLIDKQGKIETVGYNKFAEKEIKIYDTDTNKEIVSGMMMPTKKQTIKAKINHLPSQREDFFDIIVDRKHSHNYVIGMEYKVGDDDWTKVPNPVYYKNNTAENPYRTNSISANQVVILTKEQKDKYTNKEVKLRIKLTKPELHHGQTSEYVEVGSAQPFVVNEWKEGTEKPSDADRKELTFRFANLDEYTTNSTNWNINFFYKLEFDYISPNAKEDDKDEKPIDNPFDITKTASIEASFPPNENIFIIEYGAFFTYESISFILTDKDLHAKTMSYNELSKNENIEEIKFELNGEKFENYSDLTMAHNGEIVTVTVKLKGIEEPFETFLLIEVKEKAD